MPPVSTKYLEEKIADLEKQIGDAIGAIRNLSTENNNLLSIINKQQETINDARADIKKLESQMQGVMASVPRAHDNKITRYE